MRQWLEAAIIAVMLAGCATLEQFTEHSTRANIQFLDQRYGEYMEDEASEKGVALNLVGIYAIDKDTVFVFGSLGLAEGPGIHNSILLRSSDGGQLWQQVIPPESGEAIYHVAFVENGFGWALEILDVEDFSLRSLYRSFDHGRTWTDPIELGEWGFRPWGIKFYDKDKGQIPFDKFTANPYTDRVGVLSTTDGGMTWEETVTNLLSETNDAEFRWLRDRYSETPGSRYGSHWIDWSPDCSSSWNCTYKATGHDQSEWILYYNEPTLEFILLLRPAPNSPWRVACTIFNRFNYNNGHVSSR